MIETDTLTTAMQKAIAQSENRLSPALREALRKRVPTAYLLAGSVAFTGIYQIDLKLIDLQTGAIVYQGEVRDNPAWVWTRAHRSVGEIPHGRSHGPARVCRSGNACASVRCGPVAPRHSATTAFDCGSSRPCRGLRIPPATRHCTRPALFSLVPGALEDARGRVRFARMGRSLRRQAAETTLADAILTGSLFTLGKDGATDNIGVVLRLIDVETGQILWMGAASGRRVWRWDRMADIVSGLIGRLAEDLARYGAGAAETQIAALRDRAKDGQSWHALGQAFLERGLLQQAEEAFDKAMTFQDAQARAHAGKGQVLLRRGGHFDDGVKALRAAMRAEPDYLHAYAILAQAFLDRGMVDGVGIARDAISARFDLSPALPRVGRLVCGPRRPSTGDGVLQDVFDAPSPMTMTRRFGWAGACCACTITGRRPGHRAHCPRKTRGIRPVAHRGDQGHAREKLRGSHAVVRAIPRAS